MGFHEVLFPPKIAYGASGGPMFNTTITANYAGFEQRNINWLAPLGRWDISTGIKNQADIEEILSFFHARFGRAYGFRFKDWSDYSVLNAAIGTGNGTETVFQLVKTYVSGPTTYIRTITKPVLGSVTVYKDSVIQTSGVGIDYTNGLIIFDTAPAAGSLIHADFEFHVPVRFDLDQITISAIGPGQFACDSITLTEIRL